MDIFGNTTPVQRLMWRLAAVLAGSGLLPRKSGLLSSTLTGLMLRLAAVLAGSGLLPRKSGLLPSTLTGLIWRLAAVLAGSGLLPRKSGLLPSTLTSFLAWRAGAQTFWAGAQTLLRRPPDATSAVELVLFGAHSLSTRLVLPVVNTEVERRRCVLLRYQLRSCSLYLPRSHT